MGKIVHVFQTGVYANGVEILLDSNEKITVAQSSAGIKIYEATFGFLPKVIWRSDNVSFIEKCFPSLTNNFIGGPIEQIASEILERFKNKKELLSFLENTKV